MMEPIAGARGCSYRSVHNVFHDIENINLRTYNQLQSTIAQWMLVLLCVPT